MAKPQYRRKHQRLRAALEPEVQAGRAYCAEPVCIEPTRHIRPGTPWDLAHNRETGGYRGPAHARCNRSEGSRWRRRLERNAEPPPPATRWPV